jgi:ABC-2 type transport system permease protein
MRAVWAQTRAEVKMTLRRGESLLLTLGIPVGLLVFFALVDVLPKPAGVQDSVTFLAPGILALAVMSTAMVSLAIATGFERQYGVLKRLGSTPLGRPALLAAKTASVVVVESLQVVGLLMAGALRAEVTLAAANGLYLVLLLLGGMVFPLDKLPGALRTVSRALPAAALSDALHATLASSGRVPTRAWVVMVVWAVVGPVAAAATFRWE